MIKTQKIVPSKHQNNTVWTSPLLNKASCILFLPIFWKRNWSNQILSQGSISRASIPQTCFLALWVSFRRFVYLLISVTGRWYHGWPNLACAWCVCNVALPVLLVLTTLSVYYCGWYLEWLDEKSPVAKSLCTCQSAWHEEKNRGECILVRISTCICHYHSPVQFMKNVSVLHGSLL